MSNAGTATVRTIRRVSMPLNKGKWQAMCDLARRYRAEKNQHLPYYGCDAHFAAQTSHRLRRDELVAGRYTSPVSLQARMWKMALKDAYETVERNWAALAKDLKPLIAQHETWSEAGKHYAYWLIYTSHRIAQLMSGTGPVPARFSVSEADQRGVRNYLRRVIRRKRGRRSVAKAARSIALDANMYEVFEEGQRQYIKVMSLTPGQRIAIPLTGHTPISGNLRIVLDFERQRVEVHYTAAIKKVLPMRGEPCGLDAGVTEVFTDEAGKRYEAGFGQTLAAHSDSVCDTGRKRAKLREIAKQAEQRGDRAKAARIRKFNLGHKKQDAQRRRMRAEIARQINTAIAAVMRQRHPSMLITERLDVRGKAKSKRLSRLVSQWARSTLKERVEFKASAGGSRREQVNPAYSSQTCPVCGFVHRDNRRGDRFQCLHCKHIDDADRVAAHNLKARWADPEIHLWTPKARVKAILLDRFNARLERGT